MGGQLLLTAVAIIFGYLFEILVWGSPATIAFPFLIAVAEGIGWFTLQFLPGQPVPHWRSWWLFFPPVFFSTTAWLTASQPTSLKYNLSLAFTFLYLALLAMTYLGGRLYWYSTFDYIRNFGLLVWGVLQQPVLFIRQIGQGNDEDQVSILYSRSIAGLTFVGLSLLLLLAHSAFWWVFRAWFNTMQGPGEGNLLRALVFAYLILGLYLYAGTQSQDVQLTTDAPQIFFIRWLNYTSSFWVIFAAMIPITAANVFRFFVVLDPYHYLNDFGLPAWLDERLGFWCLASAAAAVFAVVCWLDLVTVYDEDQPDQLVHSIANFYLLVNSGMMMWTAFIGVSLETFGITATRHIWYARMGLAWLGLMFAMFILFQYFQRQREYPFWALFVTTSLVAMFCMAGAIIVNL